MTQAIQETGIKAWIRALSGYGAQNVLLANQNGPRPNTDYATFSLLRSEPASLPIKTRTVPDPNPTLIAYDDFTTQDLLTYSVDVYSLTGADVLRRLWLSRAVPPIRKALKAAGLTLKRKSIIRNLAFVMGDGFTPRFSCDFTFMGEAVLDTSVTLSYVQYLFDSFDLRGTWTRPIDQDLDMQITG